LLDPKAEFQELDMPEAGKFLRKVMLFENK